jgi:hypothetical protein
MAVILEDFVWFPNASGFPSGPFDLEGVEYSDNGIFSLDFRLGFVYDFYLLKFTVSDCVRWELWHLDSAVMHVEEEKEADNPPFQWAPFSLACDLPLHVEVAGQIVEDRAVRMSTRSTPSGFAIEFETASGEKVALTEAGWRRSE